MGATHESVPIHLNSRSEKKDSEQSAHSRSLPDLSLLFRKYKLSMLGNLVSCANAQVDMSIHYTHGLDFYSEK